MGASSGGLGPALILISSLALAGCGDESSSSSETSSASAGIDSSNSEDSRLDSAPPPVFVSKTSGYAFTVDERAVEADFYPLDDLDNDPETGDVATVYGRTVILGAPGVVRLKTKDFRDGRTLRSSPDGTETLFAYDFSRDVAHDRTKEVTSTFGPIELSELRTARALEIAGWDSIAMKLLQTIDPEHTCVTITEEAVQAPAMGLPTLPSDLRCLVIRESSSGGWFLDLSRLRTLPELRFLKVSIISKRPFDARWLEKNTKLRHLIIDAPVKLDHAEALGALKELISLDLAYFFEGTDIDFVENLSSLQRLDITETKVTDLSPIAGATSLEEVRANGAPIDTLPSSRVPSLRELRVVGSKLPNHSVARFRKQNPTCAVWDRWNAALRDASQGATRLRVRTGGICHRHPEAERSIAVINEAEAVRSFMSHIEVVENDASACACCGRFTVELYRENKLVVAFSVHHGKRLRWSEGWPGDAKLTDDSRHFLERWMLEKGVSIIEEEPDRSSDSQS